MQCIHQPWDLLEANLLRDMLASEGITAFLQGEHLMGAIGELPAGGLLALLVEDKDAERARDLVAAYSAAEPLPAEEPVGGPGELLC